MYCVNASIFSLRNENGAIGKSLEMLTLVVQ
jgi:hypothetical protein